MKLLKHRLQRFLRMITAIKGKKITAILFILLLWTMVCGLWTMSYAAIPHLINYQGKLSDSAGKPLTGTYNVTFKIYDVEAGGTPLWTETYTGLSVDRGIFNIMLGGVTALNLPFDKQYWLGIQVGSDPEMTPRQRIASSGYAFRTENADTAQNANKINNIEASTTPQANKLLSLDSGAKLPISALKVYDSGWFAISAGNTYIKTHNLGTKKLIGALWFSTSADGSSTIGLSSFYETASANRGSQLQIVDNNTVQVVCTNSATFAIANYGYGNFIQSGYARVILLALE